MVNIRNGRVGITKDVIYKIQEYKLDFSKYTNPVN